MTEMTGPVVTEPMVALVAAVIVVLVLGIVMLGRRPQYDHRLAEFESKLGQVDSDVRNVRQVVNNLPTNADFSRLAAQVATSGGQLEGMKATLSANGRSLERIEDYLLRASADAVAAGKTKGT